MISYRLKGLVNLHIIATAFIATAYFLGMALAVPYLPFLELNPYVNLLLYSLPILLGILFGSRLWRELGARFHLMTWADATVISSRQILVVALFIFTLMVATKDQHVSRLFLASYLVSCSFVLLVTNRFLPGYLAGLAFPEAHRVPTLFVGPSRTLRKLQSWIAQQHHLGIRLVGILSDDLPSEGGFAIAPWLGKVERLSAVIEERSIGQVVLLELPADPAVTQSALEACQSAGCRLLIYQDFWERLPIPMAPVLEHDHLFLTVHDEPLEDPVNRAVKRAFDIAVSLPVVVLVLPILSLIVAIVQRIQAPGPLFFKRSRGGQRRHEFVMLKYRSMFAVNADDNLEAQQARRGDNRIYPFGGFLRKTSLDEFPQFFNVLLGQMSIVGPRPHLPLHDVEFSLVAKTYRTRQLVKPGITGLAQVNGFRGEITDPEMLRQRVQMDIEYITHWSLWLDVQITVRTFIQIFLPPKSAL